VAPLKGAKLCLIMFLLFTKGNYILGIDNDSKSCIPLDDVNGGERSMLRISTSYIEARVSGKILLFPGLEPSFMRP